MRTDTFMTILALAAAMTAGGLRAKASEAEEYWMWGHHPDSFDVAAAKGENYNFPKGRRIDMADACRFLGVGKCCVVRWRGLPAYPYDDYARQFTNLDEIAWSIVDSGKESFAWKQDEALRLAGQHGNLTTFFLDDFFNGDWKKLPPDDLRAFKARARAVNPKSRLACVLYADTNGINPDFNPSLDVCDVVSLWFWNGKSLATMRTKVEELRRLIGPEKKVLLGIYLWDFGGKKPLTRAETAAQLATAEWLLDRGLVNGLIFHCTPLVDLNLDSVDCARTWLRERKGARQVTAHTRRTPFNADWEFRREGEAGWTAVTLPHDAALDQGYDRTLDPDQGFARAPRTVYRKSFLRPSGEGSFALRFDGVHLESSVSLNGRRIGGFHTGYLPFEVPLGDLAPTNTVEVDVSAPQGNARWYQGCGILRDVWLVRRDGWALEPEDVAVTTELDADGSARVKVRVEGAKVVEPANGELLVREPRLWTPETPHLEELEVVAENAAGERDSLRVRYGIRAVEFTTDRGLLLNGRPYRIKGICQHETFGALGAAFSAAATKREMRALKDLGVNAIRTVHNPFSPRFYDLCDELGFLVKDEAFDEWRVKHTANGYYRFFDACWTNDLRRFVRRDRNHPSVVIWSIGNEIPDHWKSADAGALARAMVGEVHALDPSRPVTAGLCRPGPANTNGVMAALDVVGLNYNAGWFVGLRGKRPVFGSETAPSLAERDTYLYEEKDGRMTPIQSVGHRECAYSPKAFGWAAPAETALRVQIDSPWSAGEFAWCTYDYLGEPNHTGRNRPDYWPARSSYWGLCDLAGFPKDRYYLYRSQWNETSPTVHLMPDWTWPGKEGRVFPVWCYTNAREAELFLNGRSQGVRRFADTKDLHLSWDVAYEPGVLEVRAKMADGTVVADRKVTAGPVARYRVTRDFAADGLVFFRVDAVDKAGNRVIACEDEVRVKVANGTLVATDNGDATDHTPFASPVRRLFRGSLLVIVREAAIGAPTLEISG